MLRGPSSCPPGILPATSVDCYNAQASVEQMNQTFQNLGQPAAFSASVASITQSLADAMPYIAVVGFCDKAKSIGCEADALTNQMLSASNQSPINPTPGTQGLQPGAFDLSSFLGTPALILLALGIGLYVYATKH